MIIDQKIESFIGGQKIIEISLDNPSSTCYSIKMNKIQDLDILLQRFDCPEIDKNDQRRILSFALGGIGDLIEAGFEVVFNPFFFKISYPKFDISLEVKFEKFDVLSLNKIEALIYKIKEKRENCEIIRQWAEN